MLEYIILFIDGTAIRS